VGVTLLSHQDVKSHLIPGMGVHLGGMRKETGFESLNWRAAQSPPDASAPELCHGIKSTTEPLVMAGGVMAKPKTPGLRRVLKQPFHPRGWTTLRVWPASLPQSW
jgi:hypothetical protein